MSERMDCLDCGGCGHGAVKTDTSTGRGYADDCNTCDGVGTIERNPR